MHSAAVCHEISHRDEQFIASMKRTFPFENRAIAKTGKGNGAGQHFGQRDCVQPNANRRTTADLSGFKRICFTGENSECLREQAETTEIPTADYADDHGYFHRRK